MSIFREFLNENFNEIFTSGKSAFSGTMLVIGALLLNNTVGGALYRPPLATRTTHEDAPNDDKAAKEAELHGEDTETATEDVEKTIRKMEDVASQDDRLSDIQANPDAAADDAGKNSLVGVVRKCSRLVRSSLWTNVPFIVYCMMVSGVQGCIQSVLIFLPARAQELGAGPSGAALILTLFGVFDMGGRFAFGFVFDIGAVVRRRYCHVICTVGLH